MKFHSSLTTIGLAFICLTGVAFPSVAIGCPYPHRDDCPQNKKEVNSTKRDDGNCQSQPNCYSLCPYDKTCEPQPWNLLEIPCSCGCQICKDGRFYSGFDRKPLNDIERQECPDIRAPCTKY